MQRESLSSRNVSTATILATIAFAGQAIAYVLSIVVARNLDVAGFEAYIVASAVFSLMVMVAPRGLEKYSLKVLPPLLRLGKTNQASDYIRFSAKSIVVVSLTFAIIVAVTVSYFEIVSPSVRLAIVVSCVSLPAGALVHFILEALAASGRTVFATAVVRFIVPIVVLVMVVVLLRSGVELTGAVAVGSWGAAWLLALIIMAYGIRASYPSSFWRSRPINRSNSWLREARPFWYYRIALALLAQVAVIALDQLQPSAAAVGAYAIAAATAGLPLALVTSTNRYYARDLAILVERREFAEMAARRRERLRWLAPLIALYLVFVFVFGRQILGFFRPEFVSDGIAALRLLSVATAVSMVFALAPTYMKFAGNNRATLTIVSGAAILHLALLVLLVPRFASLGAAIAYTIAICGMYLTFAGIARRELSRLLQEGADNRSPKISTERK